MFERLERFKTSKLNKNRFKNSKKIRNYANIVTNSSVLVKDRKLKAN